MGHQRRIRLLGSREREGVSERESETNTRLGSDFRVPPTLGHQRGALTVGLHES
jgi:hypothetical protein